MYSACETGRVDIVRALLARGVRADGEHDRVGFMLEAKAQRTYENREAAEGRGRAHQLNDALMA